MLDLINQERTGAGLAPLTFNGDLNEASEDHSTWMLGTDTFSHTGQSGSSAGDRIVAAGYELEGNWTWGENIGWQSERGAPGLADDVEDIHQSLMNSPGHRANILNPSFEEIGIGIERGDFENFDSVMVTQNFGATDAVMDDPDPQQPPMPDDPTTGAPDDDEPPIAEGPDDEAPTDDEPPVAEGPDGETPDDEPPVAEGPDSETPDDEPPVTEGPDDEAPDDEEPPVAEGPDDDTPDSEPPIADGPDGETPDDEPPVAEGPDDETPDGEPPVAEGPDDETPDDQEPPVAEGPDGETPDAEPPVAEGPDHDGFDVDQFLADLSDMLEGLFDGFDFVASGDCDTIDMEDDPVTDTDALPQSDDMGQDDMAFMCDDWPADEFDFQVSVSVTIEFDLV